MEVIPKNCKTHPLCPHGPCMMFERRSANGAKTGRRFFACSACRDRSVCNYFHWVDDKISPQKEMHWKGIIEKHQPRFSHDVFMKRLTIIKNLPLSDRKYCKTCSLLILPKESNHKGHETVDNVTNQHLLQPTSLFQSLENKKAEAQYFFSEKTVRFVTKLLFDIGFSKLLLVGVPKIHEHITANQKEYPNLSSFLMDIDHRYMQFFGSEDFCHYNLFNNHFFGGKDCKNRLKEFLNENDSKRMAILLDPPFGGLIDAISYSLQTINKWWKTINAKGDSERMPVLWFFPYFLEPRIVKNCPDLAMMDYKVDYSNQKKFGKKANHKGSPVRIFTNILASSFTLPENEGYRFCKKCQKFVSLENLHCIKCNSCTTKHGNTYKHCDSCQRCVKNSYVHCDTHNKCSPKVTDVQDASKTSCSCNPNQEEGNDFERCYKCFGYGHRRRNCPTNPQSTKKNKRRKKN